MYCWPRYLFILMVSVLGIGQMVAACGQKGDLYLPKPEAPNAQPAKAPNQRAAKPAAVQTGASMRVDQEIKRTSQLSGGS